MKRRGLQIADDCRLIAWPSCFGSEPWLVSIGRHVIISYGVRFITHDGATWVFRNRPGYSGVIRYGRITVHDNCFIGTESVILPGVSIGPNSIVGAGAVVRSDIPPDEVWGGVPARYLCRVDDFAQKALHETPPYDPVNYRRNKREELLRHYPYPW
jgi:acetyltransferase-like isoleucine patch superfamily enzyme